jgi:hypothetical protein
MQLQRDEGTQFFLHEMNSINKERNYHPSKANQQINPAHQLKRKVREQLSNFHAKLKEIQNMKRIKKTSGDHKKLNK